MTKKKLWIAILVAFVVLASSVVYLNRAVIFQRGNPIPYLTAAARISEKNPYVAVDEAKGIYISKRGECPELLEYYQEKTGMEFVEQAGSSYLFTDGSRNEVASSEVYWGRYTVWVLPTMEAAENADAEQYDTAAFLENALNQLGLTRKEANEFIVYWLPLMKENPYNLIAFQSDSYTQAAQLSIEPAPDTLLRVFMAWKPLESAVDISTQNLTAPLRTGFTAVEWGGCQVK